MSNGRTCPVCRGSGVKLCEWVFKRRGCGYTGDAENCLQRFQDCRRLGNEVRFGGQSDAKCPGCQGRKYLPARTF